MAAPDQNSSNTDLKYTPLHALHTELGAKMVPFAGYKMPVTFPQGLIKEHLHTRQAAGLFDVSHMGQAVLSGANHDETAAALEALVPADIAGLARGRQRYTQLLNEEGGIIDDLMVTRPLSADEDGKLLLIVNAARKDVDYAHIDAHLPPGVMLSRLEDRALLALQGPAAARIMADICPDAAELNFMTASPVQLYGIDCHISRSGYTGEDGFEISLVAEKADSLARRLLDRPEVTPVGLGARDTLRLEAGLCLYGHDIDETTSPVEAGLVWSIGKRRLEDGNFPGAERIRTELADGPPRCRVGLRPAGRAPAREGCQIISEADKAIGQVTSGSFAPSVGGPIAMGYVERAYAEPDHRLNLMIRNTPHQAQIVSMPFVPHHYFRRTKSGKTHG